jgi:hypothetical protein
MGFRLVRFDDWEALYDDEGDKLLEGHTIPTEDLFREIGADCVVTYVSDAFCRASEQIGYVPETLAEYPDLELL